MQIITSPNPILRQPCEEIKPEELKKYKSIAKNMAKTMYKNDGCGLAGPQVGITKRIIVVDCDLEPDAPRNPLTLINPVLKDHGEETETCPEGCLSIPGITVPITRYTHVVVEALNLDGEVVTYDVTDFFARCLQHEMDHLEGDTMFERLDALDRIEALKAYEQALLRGAKPGDTGLED